MGDRTVGQETVVAPRAAARAARWALVAAKAAVEAMSAAAWEAVAAKARAVAAVRAATRAAVAQPPERR